MYIITLKQSEEEFLVPKARIECLKEIEHKSKQKADNKSLNKSLNCVRSFFRLALLTCR